MTLRILHHIETKQQQGDNMKTLLLATTLLLSVSTTASEFNVDSFLNKTYVTVGAGYKFDESEFKFIKDGKRVKSDAPISARIEMGYHYNKNVKFGISHHSQWLSGWPINGDKEPSKTEIFIDYTFTLNELF
jgi:hypothetical protein